MKVTFRLIIIATLITITERLFKGLEVLDELRSSKQLYYWEWPEYREKSWRLEETCCHSISSEKSSANAVVKKKNLSNEQNNNRIKFKIIYLKQMNVLQRANIFMHWWIEESEIPSHFFYTHFELCVFGYGWGYKDI